MRKSPKCDSQRSEVYTWERKYIYATVGDMGTKRFYQMLRHACKMYGVPRPVAGRIPRAWKDWTAVCDVENKALWFAPEHCTAKVLLHELAHWILHSYGLQGPEHGAVWLGLYLWLMDKYMVLPLDASIPSARAAGLQFIEPGRATPKSLRELAEAMKIASQEPR